MDYGLLLLIQFIPLGLEGGERTRFMFSMCYLCMHEVCLVLWLEIAFISSEQDPGVFCHILLIFFMFYFMENGIMDV